MRSGARGTRAAGGRHPYPAGPQELATEQDVKEFLRRGAAVKPHRPISRPRPPRGLEGGAPAERG